MKKIVSLLTIPLFLGLCAWVGGTVGPQLASGQRRSQGHSVHRDLRRFGEVYRIVAQNYAGPVQPSRAIFDGAIPGMLRTLDPHSTFFGPREFARMEEEQSSHYYGVGMEIRGQGSHTVIWLPFVGSPAYRAGLRPGDVIVGINGKSAVGLNTNQIADLLKGPKGTVVRIAVMREGHAHPLVFSVTRAAVHDSTVTCAFQLAPGIGFIHLGNGTSGFSASTHRDMVKALRELGGPAHLKGLVLDLRNNPGGLLDQAVKVADMFLAKGQVIVSHHGRNSPDQVYTALHGNHGYNYPMVVLVNNDTASAAEIVTGARSHSPRRSCQPNNGPVHKLKSRGDDPVSASPELCAPAATHSHCQRRRQMRPQRRLPVVLIAGTSSNPAAVPACRSTCSCSCQRP